MSDDPHVDDMNLSLGQWVTMPRRSRRVARQEAPDPFIDVEPLENHGTGKEVLGITMFHKATGNKEADYACSSRIR